MIFIDDGVKMTVTGFTVSRSGQYRYDVLYYGRATQTIFSGYCYLLSGQTSKQFDITDLVRNNIVTDDGTNGYNGIYNRYRVNLTLPDVSNIDGVVYYVEDWVANINRYPNRKTEMETVFNDYHQPAVPMLQGVDMASKTLKLVPHYPAKPTTNFKFDLVYSNNSTSAKKLHIGNVNFNMTSTPASKLFKFSQTMYNLLLHTSGGPTEVYISVGDVDRIKVAELDRNPHSKYYIKWKDRYGSFQVQPFCKVETYSENIKKDEYITYDGRRRVFNVEVEPKWEVQTGWIDQRLYPYYESIFVNDSVELYDVENDVTYNVIVEDNDYTEKTVSNQGRNLFNLKLKLVLDKKQQIMY